MADDAAHPLPHTRTGFFALRVRAPRTLRALRGAVGALLIVLAMLIPGGWTWAGLFGYGSGEGDAFLESVVLRPIRVNGVEGMLLWLHTDPAFANKMRPSVTIPELREAEVQSGFVAIQGHGEVFRGEHYLLVEGVHQWIPTRAFVATVREWLGYDAQVLLLACNPDGVNIDIPNTIYWRDSLVDVTYGLGPWVMGKWIEDDPINGRQRPVNTADLDPMGEAQGQLHNAIEKLHAAVAASGTSAPE